MLDQIRSNSCTQSQVAGHGQRAVLCYCPVIVTHPIFSGPAHIITRQHYTVRTRVCHRLRRCGVGGHSCSQFARASACQCMRIRRFAVEVHSVGGWHTLSSLVRQSRIHQSWIHTHTHTHLLMQIWLPGHCVAVQTPHLPIREDCM